MKLSDFDFQLPEELIALRPANPRSKARLLTYTPGKIEDSNFFKLADILEKGDRLIINDSKVIPARLKGQRIRRDAVEGGKASVEVTLIKHFHASQWKALIKPLRKVNVNDKVVFGDGLTAIVVEKTNGQAKLSFDIDDIPFEDKTSCVETISAKCFFVVGLGSIILESNIFENALTELRFFSFKRSESFVACIETSPFFFVVSII